MERFNDKIETENNNEYSKEAFDEAVKVLGPRFHEDWRKTRLNDNGTFEPRLKTTKDQEWISTHGTNEVDIANSTYDELPEDWKGENKAAAEVIAKIFNEYSGNIELENPIIRSQVGNKIHDAWIERNGEWAPEEQKLSFDDLSIEEQEKDLEQIRIAKEVFEN